MLTRKLIAAGSLSVAICLAAASAASAVIAVRPAAVARIPQARRLSTHLTVTSQAKPACVNGICTIHNSGTGTMAGYGEVTFTTVITDDTTSSPCTGGSWVPRLVRTITTTKGTLVLNEAGIVCMHPKVGPRVDLVWAVDSTDSTGAFRGATGTGIDHAYPQSTATQTGTLMLAAR